ncbi:MAG TPA: ribonuclease H-like domain-containing protein, partial [Fimbriimonas sp.]|nr:ribonuclease H-like domain-containing protein [Fimbriimonas sp.]
RDRMSHFGMIVTFFGLSFDVPMILKRFPRMVMDQVHFDLCPTLRDVGYKGGLKKIEKDLGIARGEDTDGLNGRDAIYLWRRYDRNGDDAALATLIAYNREDVVNLKTLARIAYDKKKDMLMGTLANQ